MTTNTTNTPNRLSATAGLPEFLRPEEVFAILRMGRTAGYDAIHRGDIPHVKIGHRIFIPRVGLEELILKAFDA